MGGRTAKARGSKNPGPLRPTADTGRDTTRPPNHQMDWELDDRLLSARRRGAASVYCAASVSEAGAVSRTWWVVAHWRA